MTDLTAGDAWRRQEEMEAQAACILGRLLLAFSRLDTNVGLLLVSIERVQGRESAAAQVPQLAFRKRLERVSTFIDKAPTLPEPARNAYRGWLVAADSARAQRNDLVHGRWGIEPYKRKVLNIVGLPSSAEQRTVEYSLEELQAAVARVEDLQTQLSRLRSTWPV